MKFLDNHGEKILYITWGILFLIILIAGCDVKVHASSSGSTEIPYNVAEMSSYNEMMLEYLPTAITYYRNTFNVSSDVPLLVWTQDGYYNDFCYQYYFMQNPTLTTGYTYPEGFDFSSNYIRVSSTSQIGIILVGNSGDHVGTSSNLGLNANFCGTAQSVQTPKGYYLPRYPFYYDGDPLVDEVNNTEVLIARVSGSIAVEGHATEPNLTDNNIDNLTKPDIQDYLPTPTNPPAINNNSLEDLVESLFDLVKWHAGNIAGIVQGLGDYLGDVIYYVGQKIIDNIKNGINNLYQNFKSLFEPLLNALSSLTQNISDKVDYITAPIDQAAISSGIESTDLATDVAGYKTALTTFVGSFDSVSEPSTYKIPIHFENISMFSDVGIQYIDLGWLNSVKTLIRGFVACLVTYGVIISIFDSVPNYINGGGGEDD